MSGSHIHALFRHGESPIHGLPSHLKIVATFGFVVAAVLTPREAIWAFAVHAGLLSLVIGLSRLPLRFVATRMVVLVPFLLAAWTLPVLGGEPHNGLGLSIEGLWGAWNITVKGALGTMASVILAATTEVPDVVSGLERLRAPRVVTSIMGFMARYLEAVVQDMSRMRIAMRSRGYHPRWLGGAGAFGQSIGALFVRTFERGERVYLAMISRGYQGEIPPAAGIAVSARSVAAIAVFLASAWAVAVGGMMGV